MIQVLLADDQELVRSGFRVLLETASDIQVIGEATDGHHAVTLTRQLHPDVVLMDIQMPGTDGLDATRQITSDPALDTVRVIILTTFDEDAMSLRRCARAPAASWSKTPRPANCCTPYAWLPTAKRCSHRPSPAG
jgi:DNA-binding NarL/FixJ family response regulator